MSEPRRVSLTVSYTASVNPDDDRLCSRDCRGLAPDGVHCSLFGVYLKTSGTGTSPPRFRMALCTSAEAHAAVEAKR